MDIRNGGNWKNMDGFVDDARVVKHDMVDLPWPFAASSMDVVYASHVLEHIPTVFRTSKKGLRDVLFEVMEEIHRVLRPDGLLHAAMPLSPFSAVNMP